MGKTDRLVTALDFATRDASTAVIVVGDTVVFAEPPPVGDFIVEYMVPAKTGPISLAAPTPKERFRQSQAAKPRPRDQYRRGRP